MMASDRPATGDDGRSTVPPPREYQQLWFTLARRPWKTAVFVPADVEGSAVETGRALARVGAWLQEAPIPLLVMSDPMDRATVTQRLASRGQKLNEPLWGDPGRVIVALQPVIAEPFGLGVIQVADVIIVCVEKERTRIGAARRTVELIGRERITGCFITR